MTRPALISAVVDAEPAERPSDLAAHALGLDARPLPAFADPVSRRRGSLQYTLRELERRRTEARYTLRMLEQRRRDEQRRLDNLELQIGAVEGELARLGGGEVER